MSMKGYKASENSSRINQINSSWRYLLFNVAKNVKSLQYKSTEGLHSLDFWTYSRT